MQQFIIKLLNLFIEMVSKKPALVANKPTLKIVPNLPEKPATIEVKPMQVSQQGLDLIYSCEGLRLEPYLDSKGIPTIGIGATFYLDGTKVTMQDKPITKEQAFELLKNVLKLFEIEVQKLIKVPLNQNQYDAIMCLVYNIGTNAFSNSTLLKLLNNNDYEKAAEEFPKWNKSGGVIVKGLVTRRAKEQELFLK